MSWDAITRVLGMRAWYFNLLLQGWVGNGRLIALVSVFMIRPVGERIYTVQHGRKCGLKNNAKSTCNKYNRCGKICS